MADLLTAYTALKFLQNVRAGGSVFLRLIKNGFGRPVGTMTGTAQTMLSAFVASFARVEMS